MKFIKKLLVASMLITGFMSFGVVNANAEENLVEPAAAVRQGYFDTDYVYSKDCNFTYDDYNATITYKLTAAGEYTLNLASNAITFAQVNGKIYTSNTNDSKLTVVVKGSSATFTANKITAHVRVEFRYNGNPVGSQNHSFTAFTL